MSRSEPLRLLQSDPEPRPLPIRCTADALRLLFLSASHPLQHETLAFLLDPDGRGGVITIVSGTIEADSVLHVAECMVQAARKVEQAAALVLASVRPGGCLLPGDLDRWMEASSLVEEYGITLIDWFIITETGAECPRDLLGEPHRWSVVRQH